MVVTNLNNTQPDHASLAAKYAVQAMNIASKVPIDVDNPAAGYVQCRFGFHSGPVVTHVVGTRTPRCKYRPVPELMSINDILRMYIHPVLLFLLLLCLVCAQTR